MALSGIFLLFVNHFNANLFFWDLMSLFLTFTV